MIKSVKKMHKIGKEDALKVLDMFLCKQCDLERTSFAYDQSTVWGAVKMATDALAGIGEQAAEPERAVGHWVGIDDFPHEEWECDVCGKIVSEPSEYCPECGAKMIKDDEQDNPAGS